MERILMYGAAGRFSCSVCGSCVMALFYGVTRFSSGKCGSVVFGPNSSFAFEVDQDRAKARLIFSVTKQGQMPCGYFFTTSCPWY